MPTGVYFRSPEYREKMIECLKGGRKEESRSKATEKIKRYYSNELVRMQVSVLTKIKMRDPVIRKRHLEGLKRSKKHRMVGCNGTPTTEVINKWSNCLLPLGYKREVSIRTAGHGTIHKPPNSYKADFANEEKRVVIEIDGPYHNLTNQKIKDRKKTEVLEALGWKVIRIK